MSRLIKRLGDTPHFELLLIVSGSHLCTNFGRTIDEIVAAGIEISCVIDYLGAGSTKDDHLATIIGMGNQFFRDTVVDIILIPGDRYEMLGFAVCATFHDIPIVHIHGGEKTDGSKDDIYRHAITRLATFHVCSTERSKIRIRQMGVHENNIEIVGSLGVEAALLEQASDAMDNNLPKFFDYELSFFIVTYHPNTDQPEDIDNELAQILAALVNKADINFIITGSNSDVTEVDINSYWKSQISKYRNLYFIESLGQSNYFRLLSRSKGVIGNSSSGIIEVPSFGKYSINLGARQKGRERSSTVIDVEFDSQKIINAIDQALREPLVARQNPYFRRNTTHKIIQFLDDIRKGKSGDRCFIDYPVR